MANIPFSTTIHPELKKAANLFCKKRGLKLQHLVEEALLDYLEDEMDLEACRERMNEESIPLESLLKQLKLK